MCSTIAGTAGDEPKAPLSMIEPSSIPQSPAKSPPKEPPSRQLSKILQKQLPPLVDSELSEKFVRGSGNGGQKVNKTSNKVVLVHIPTGVKVECHDTRSLEQNRKIARRRLQEKIDNEVNGELSKASVKGQIIVKKKTKNAAKAAKRRRLKAEAKDAGAATAQNADEGI
jgi:hypothetical protein